MRKRATAGLLQGGSFRRRSNIALVGLWGRHSLETGSPLAGPPALTFMRNIQLRQSRQAHGPQGPQHGTARCPACKHRGSDEALGEAQKRWEGPARGANVTSTK